MATWGGHLISFNMVLVAPKQLLLNPTTLCMIAYTLSLNVNPQIVSLTTTNTPSFGVELGFGHGTWNPANQISSHNMQGNILLQTNKEINNNQDFET